MIASSKKIILLAQEGISTDMVGDALFNAFQEHLVIIIEKKQSKFDLLKNKIKKYGIFDTIGQLSFLMSIIPILKIHSKKYLNILAPQIKKQAINIQYVSSVNSELCRELLSQINPEFIIVNGTRIISQKTLNSSNAKWINTHAGITPEYRGVHGAYWALYNGRKDLCGFTIHLIDKGIDTGAILKQGLISINEKDNFITYPIKQYLAAIPQLILTINEFKNNSVVPTKISKNEFSKQWYHPSIWQYIYGYLFKGVK